MRKHGITVTRSIAAPADRVRNLLADARTWPRWAPFGGAPTLADVTVTPATGDASIVTWRGEPGGWLPGTARLRRNRLAGEVALLLAALAAHAEDAPTTRIEWAARNRNASAVQPATALAA